MQMQMRSSQSFKQVAILIVCKGVERVSVKGKTRKKRQPEWRSDIERDEDEREIERETTPITTSLPKTTPSLLSVLHSSITSPSSDDKLQVMQRAIEHWLESRQSLLQRDMTKETWT